MMAVYTAWIVLLASAHFLLPGQRAVFWGLLAAEAEALLRVGRGLVPQLPGSRRLMRAHLAPAC
jgi:hypothetical protein